MACLLGVSPYNTLRARDGVNWALLTLLQGLPIDTTTGLNAPIMTWGPGPTPDVPGTRLYWMDSSTGVYYTDGVSVTLVPGSPVGNSVAIYYDADADRLYYVRESATDLLVDVFDGAGWTSLGTAVAAAQGFGSIAQIPASAISGAGQIAVCGGNEIRRWDGAAWVLDLTTADPSIFPLTLAPWGSRLVTCNFANRFLADPDDPLIQLRASDGTWTDITPASWKAVAAARMCWCAVGYSDTLYACFTRDDLARREIWSYNGGVWTLELDLTTELPPDGFVYSMTVVGDTIYCGMDRNYLGGDFLTKEFNAAGLSPAAGPTLTGEVGGSVTDGAHTVTTVFVTLVGRSLPSPARGLVAGPLPAPTTPPVAALAAGGDVTAGDHYYAYTEDTPTGETEPSPVSATVTTLAAEADPPTALTLDLGGTNRPGAGLDPGAIYGWAYTFWDGGTRETAPCPVAITTMLHNPGFDAAGAILASSIPAPPAGFQVRFYRTEGNLATLKLLPYGQAEGQFAELTPGGYYIDVKADATLGVVAPAVNASAVQTVTLALPPPTSGLDRIVYGTTAGGADLRRVGNAGVALSYDVTIADGALGPPPPSAPPTVNRFAAADIAIGPVGTVARELYMSAADDPATRYLVATIPDNTATDGVSLTLADSLLRAQQVEPTEDTSGLPITSGAWLHNAIPPDIQTPSLASSVQFFLASREGTIQPPYGNCSGEYGAPVTVYGFWDAQPFVAWDPATVWEQQRGLWSATSTPQVGTQVFIGNGVQQNVGHGNTGADWTVGEIDVLDPFVLTGRPPNGSGFANVQVDNSLAPGHSLLGDANFPLWLPDGYEFVCPSLLEVDPPSGAVDGGYTVTLRGQWFYDGVILPSNPLNRPRVVNRIWVRSGTGAGDDRYRYAEVDPTTITVVSEEAIKFPMPPFPGGTDGNVALFFLPAGLAPFAFAATLPWGEYPAGYTGPGGITPYYRCGILASVFAYTGVVFAVLGSLETVLGLGGYGSDVGFPGAGGGGGGLAGPAPICPTDPDPGPCTR